MYVLLLSLRYLRTRYLAFVSIVSVMLGVATLIVVNAVMSGFSNGLKDRLHGVQSDVIADTDRADGFGEPTAAVLAKVRGSAVGRHVAAVAPTVETYGLMRFTVRDRTGRPVPVTKHVRVIGVDPGPQAAVGQFARYLTRQRHAAVPSFDLTPDAQARFQMNRLMDEFAGPVRGAPAADPPAAADWVPAIPDVGPLLSQPPTVPPPAVPAADPPRVPGVILGYTLAHARYKDPATGQPREAELLRPGDDVLLTTVGASGDRPVSATFAVCDYFQSENSEYDSSFVYVPLADLQRLRGMGDRATAVQVRLADAVRHDPRFLHERAVPALQAVFPPDLVRVESWQQKQGSVLAAIDIERGILNLLLFMIVGVAGFSVLAIFTMTVGEKYRDIGVLKALGASDRGVLAIFVGYGLLLGLVGAALGTAAGLAVTARINEIEAFLTRLTGHQVFDRSLYYFDRIPTHVDPLTVALVNAGAVGTAVAFGVLPALRAARLHPVRALRFE